LAFGVTIGLADFAAHSRRRGGRQSNEIQGGIDFTGCVNDPATGFCCIEKDEEITIMQKDPILECTHKNVEKCHYTYVTQFDSAQEEVCEENFEKSCQLTFKQQAFNETVKKCYRPIEKVCDGSGPRQCKTLYESSCTTKYIEKQPGKFVGDTNCEKLPIEICGSGCTTTEGDEECHDKVVTTLIDVPEETCDLNPQKTCRFVTKLVPRLKPKPECTLIPQEICHQRFSKPKPVKKALKTRWCQDPTPPEPEDKYEENENTPPVFGSSAEGNSPVGIFDEPLPGYDPQQPDTLYGAPPQNVRQGRRQSQRINKRKAATLRKQKSKI